MQPPSLSTRAVIGRALVFLPSCSRPRPVTEEHLAYPGTYLAGLTVMAVRPDILND